MGGENDNGRTRIDNVMRDAEECFWAEVAKQYPEIKSGDFSLEDAFKLHRAMTEAIGAWLSLNSSGAESFGPATESEARARAEAVAETEIGCINCGHMQDEHHDNGLCPGPMATQNPNGDGSYYWCPDQFAQWVQIDPKMEQEVRTSLPADPALDKPFEIATRMALAWLDLQRTEGRATVNAICGHDAATHGGQVVMATPTPSKVTVMVYVHRHGQDVTVYDSPASAYEAAARGIVIDNLHELASVASRRHIEGLVAESKYEEAVDYYNNEVNDEHVDVSEDVIVAGVEAVITAIAPSPKCPKCGESVDIQVKESYTAYHPVRSDLRPGRDSEIGTAGRVTLENALSTGCPSEHFNDGASDFKAHCRSCLHEGTVEDFGLGDPSEWEWV